MSKLKIGMIGLGNRGSCLLDTVLMFEESEVVAVCDGYRDRTEKAAGVVEYASKRKPAQYDDYRELLKDDKVEAVIIATSWNTHVTIAIDAMKAGKKTAMEVGGAMSVEECYKLVDAYEQTKTPFMFLENCCYGKTELLAAALAARGVLGEIVHCSGAYSHDLREEVTGGNRNRHYRLKNYINRNCENYPTHELGPIAKILGINRGNRMVGLVSVASKSAGLKEYVKEKSDTIDPLLIGENFKQGDIVNTLITCQNGETIALELDTTLPVLYDRKFTVRGTKGLYNQTLHAVFTGLPDGEEEVWTGLENSKKLLNSAEKYEAEYLPELWKAATEKDKNLGHGGMDGFLIHDFIIRCLDGREMPIDVYDAAAWMCITPLSEQSIALGGKTVAIPDFTNGEWMYRERFDVTDLGEKKNSDDVK